MEATTGQLNAKVDALEAKVNKLTGASLGPVASAIVNQPPAARQDLESAYVAAYTISHRSQVPLVVGCGFDPPVGAGYNTVRVSPSVYGFPDGKLLVSRPTADGMMKVATLEKTATSQDICQCLVGAGCTCGVNCQCGTSTVSYQQPMMGQPISYGSPVFMGGGCANGQCGPQMSGFRNAPMFTGFRGGFMGGSMCGPGGCR